MVGDDNLDLAAQHLAAKILHRHLGRGLAAGAGDVGVKARHVQDAAEFQRRLALGLSCWRAEREQRRRHRGKKSLHPRTSPLARSFARPCIHCRRSCRMVLSAASRWRYGVLSSPHCRCAYFR
jgi:hypothetical protein